MDISESNLVDPPAHVAALLTDVHCHPTDDPRPWGDVDVLTDKLRATQIGRVCAMATSVRDQTYVAQLAKGLPGKVVPAFGYHPWFVHTIAARENLDPRQHYEDVFRRSSSSTTERSRDALALIAALPDPVPLSVVLGELRANLEAHPDALLGEVGIDKVFRLPRDPNGWTRQPDEDEGVDEGEAALSGSHDHSLGLRKRPLSNLTPGIEHQLMIVKAQIALAIELRRSVSFHSVRAGGALYTLLDELKAAYPDGDAGLSKRERKRRQNERRYMSQQEAGADVCTQDSDDEGSAASFSGINLDLHSCTLSPEMITQLQRRHKNVFVSFSLAINLRQKDLPAQLRACDPRRLLIESDWHSAEGLGARCWAMLRLATDTIGSPLAPADDTHADEGRYEHAARYLHANWLRFAGRETIG